MKGFYLVRIIIGVVLVFIVVIVASGVVTYPLFFSKRVSVSWESREVLAHYENVKVPRNVSVSIPVVMLSAGLNKKNATVFSRALWNDMAGILRSGGLSPKLIEARTRFVTFGKGDSSSLNLKGPVVLVFMPYYGHETHLLYRECYASVLIYMNSNPDVGSYLSMVNRYSKEDHLSFLAGWLFKRAKGNETGPYSLEVVYWNMLRVRISNKAHENCWDVLAGEIVNETKEWAKTLRPSNES